ncbi:MAG: hypothetical protein H7Y37_00365 [Anaerolineae bacterium]|nr:hypothetical protein [Gloeobacterales cyanobacterium ES-bin-313]
MANQGNYGDFTYHLNREAQGDSKESESVLGHIPAVQATKDDQASSPTQQPEQSHSAKRSDSHNHTSATTTGQADSTLHKKSSKLNRLSQQMKKSIQTHEFASVGVAFAIGFVLSRILKK